MSMREILLANDFADNGLCPVCGGVGWLYTKIIGGKQATIKVKLTQDALRAGLEQKKFMELGTAVLQFNGSKTLINQHVNLQTVLNIQGLAKNITA